MARERDYAYEALAEVTNYHQNTNRGELNAALKLIREMTPELNSEELAIVIKSQGARYRAVMPNIVMSPGALAQHWTHVAAEAQKQRGQTNQSVEQFGCPTCQDDRMVVVSQRKPMTTRWMTDHKITAHEEHMIEEVAPCPDCNASADTVMRRFDGRVLRCPDANRVREMMTQ
jgi:hypothetical protein